ncbi:MAG: alpha/beta hydrolase [Alphaproteobacteria bacterium]|nr:alpha/beta hydrolase [Alphaproteobacteria bacterium]
MTFDWRSADDAVLEAHFNPRAAVGDEAVEAHLGEYLAAAEAARETWPGTYDIAYGSGPREALDLHRPASEANGALFMFIHGGYWRRFSKADHSFAVGGFVKRGATVANVDYDLCPDVTLDDIVAQMKACLAFVHAHAGEWGCDPVRLFVGGHSAGAHLTAMLLADPASAALIAGAHCMSGIYETPVVRRISVNEEVRLDEAMAARNNVFSHPPARPVPMVVSVGGEEPAGWQAQSAGYAGIAEAAGCAVQRVTVPGANHFSMLFDAVNAGGRSFEAFAAKM